MAKIYKIVGYDDEITLPYLHQTLVSDGVIGASDFFKSGTMLNNKAHANEQLRHQVLKNKLIYVNKTNPSEVIFKIPANLAQYQKVKFDILEINDCVNIYANRSNIRNSDIEHSRKLVAYATEQLKKMRNKRTVLGLDKIKKEIGTVFIFFK